jgi:hypothetical protein
MGSDGTENCVPEVPFGQLMLDQTHKHLRKLRWIGKNLEAQAILEALDDAGLRPSILDDRRKQSYFDWTALEETSSKWADFVDALQRPKHCARRDVGILEYGQINEGGQRLISFHLDAREQKNLSPD